MPTKEVVLEHKDFSNLKLSKPKATSVGIPAIASAVHIWGSTWTQLMLSN